MAYVDFFADPKFVTNTDVDNANLITALPLQLASADVGLGALRFQYDPGTPGGMRVLRYVKVHADSAAVANGTPLMWTDTLQTTVSTVVATGNRNFPAGVGIGTITAGNKGWIQCLGYHSAVITNGDDEIAKGDSVIYSATDGKVDSVAAGTASTYKIVGIAAAADVDAANTVATYINCI